MQLTKRDGFTIVELLIVIVVIAILATITIVAFNGIQSRAVDAAVKADIANFTKKVNLFYIDYGRYPASVSELDSLGISLSASAYNTVYFNAHYCYTNGTAADYAFGARSKSGTIFYASSKGSGNLGNQDINGIKVCQAAGLVYPSGNGQVTPGYNHYVNQWAAWTT